MEQSAPTTTEFAIVSAPPSRRQVRQSEERLIRALDFGKANKESWFIYANWDARDRGLDAAIKTGSSAMRVFRRRMATNHGADFEVAVRSNEAGDGAVGYCVYHGQRRK